MTVESITANDIFIRHARGIGNVKISDLDHDALVKLGLAKPIAKPSGSVKDASVGRQADTSSNPDSVASASLKQFFGKESRPDFLPELAKLSMFSPARLGAAVLLAGLALILGMYLFYCYCLRLICIKAGSKPGFMVWLPVLQMFPMLRAAGMSPLWFLAFFVPVFNLVAAILWCFKIAYARGKSVWVAILLLLPVTSLFAFLYLAFSDSAKREDVPGTTGIVRPLVLET